MRYWVLIAAMLLAGCNKAENDAVRACETFIKERLRSPSTYKKISDDGVGPAFKHDGRNIKMVLIEYDAANAYGTPIRGSQQCVFEVDKAGNYLDKDLEHAAKMSSIGADSEYAPCCLMDPKDRLSSDPEVAADQAEAAATAAMKAADEASAAAEKVMGDAK